MGKISDKKDSVIRIEYEAIKSQLEKILLKEGFPAGKASLLAKIFSDNSLFGKDSHGVNRFIAFIDSVKNGYVKTASDPVKVSGENAIEQWDGNFCSCPLKAMFCTQRAIELAGKFDIGTVALKNTNHWMRGGTYGRQAAEAGFALICWTNAIPTMPAWGGKKPLLGNNPLVIAFPYEEKHLVLDMALSQYSYGRLEKLFQAGEQTEYFAGYDSHGKLTKDPAAILNTKRALPIGLWKGSGLALMLDIMAAVFSNGKSSSEIGKEGTETGVSQVFIALKPFQGKEGKDFNVIINDILNGVKSSGSGEKENIFFPGEVSFRTSNENIKSGVPVDKYVWNKILKM